MAYGRALPALIALACSIYVCAAEYVYYGCVSDGPGPRTLPTQIEASDSMTVDRCREKAKNRGQTVFGVEYGRECYAGKDITQVSAIGQSTNCVMPCAGNHSQTCGGGSALSVYYNADLAKEQSSAQPVSYTYQGCYSDAGDVHRMTKLWTDPAMTVDFCARLAQIEGYSLVGLQYFTECWAGNDFAFVTALGVLASNKCNSPCGGNSSQTCGGGLANSVYNVTDLTQPATHLPGKATDAAPGQLQLPANVARVGCYADTPARLLDKVGESATMTVEVCAQMAATKGYTVFGIQYAAECWGSNDLTKAQSAGSSTACNMDCHQMPVGACGGPLANTIYKQTLPTDAAGPTATPAAPAVKSTLAITARGCYKDSFDRVMSVIQASDTMTVDICANLAYSKGYKVIGVQYAHECYAGHDLTAATRLGPADNCDSTCYSDPPNTCGGGLANSIYLLPERSNITRIGCYADTDDRLLTKVGEDVTMTASLCAQMAAAKQYTVFGIQYAKECWAGNDLGHAKSAGTSSACTIDCYQAPAGSCGGPKANTIYTQTLQAVVDAPTAPVVKSSLHITSYGCYKDKFPPDRAMDLLQASDTMTVDTCAQLAYSKGFTVIGVQYAHECYAGGNLAKATQWGLATNCDSTCYADPPNTCGGGLANSIYLLPGTTATVPPVVGDPTVVAKPTTPVLPPLTAGQLSTLDITALGCYADGNPRAMTAQLKVSPSMTVDECAQLAYSNQARYTVFGVQYGEECYAGKNETKALQYGKSTNCNSQCYDKANNPAGTCGGGLANSVYRLPYRAPLPPPPPSGYNETLVGCYADGDPRAMSQQLGVNVTGMTVAMCAGMAYKALYTIFALQYGQECWGAPNLDDVKIYGSSENCISPCPGDSDRTCGGAKANQVYTMPPIPPPTGTPAFTYVGCYQDDKVLDKDLDPPMPIKRRMWRRLGQALKMDNWECAVRAKAAGYPYFGLTSGEVFPEYGKICWGGFNLTHITELGTSADCTNRCHTFPEEHTCGGNYAISLYQLTNVQYDKGPGGMYQYLVEMPVAGSHNMQVTGKDQFLIIDFLDFDHPKTWDRHNTTYMYFRGNNSFRAVNNIRDASCGQWHRQPDGDMMGFSGYMGASGVNQVSVWATMWYHRHQVDTEDFGEHAMPIGRWYGGTMLMPDGRSYVTGGNLGPGSDRSKGADVWDPSVKSWVGRVNSMGQNTPYLPLNEPLMEASTSGGYYPGLYVLPSGAFLFAQSKTVQVINPLTGEALAAAPPIPRETYWEYPLSGSQVVMRTSVLKPGSNHTFHFIVFGGGNVATDYKPCTDFSMRIPVHVDCTVSPCTHSIGDWEVETMLGHRCQLDTAVLPNGKILIIGGVEEGLSGLGTKPDANTCPVNEPWIYDPDKPAGQRYRRTGAYTNIARFYHGSHTMTSQGDVLVTGSTIAKFFSSYHLGDFDITPYDYGEFRIEFFKPHYILGTRPAWAFVPTMISYGETFTVKLAADTIANKIIAVVLGDPGTTTHSSNMATRMNQLAYIKIDDHTLNVTAPANTFLATPTFYQLYLVADDDSYSVGAWLKLRGPWGSIPLSLPRVSQFEISASTRGEDTTSPWSISSTGSKSATLASKSAEAAGSGTYGLLLTAGDDTPIVIQGPAIGIDAGTRVHTFLWARAPEDNKVHIEFVLLAATSTAFTGSHSDPYGDFLVGVSDKYEQFPLGGLVPDAAGDYKPALRITGMKKGMKLHLDDIEVFTLTAAKAAQSLQWAQQGVSIEDQVKAASGRRLLDMPKLARKARGHVKGDTSGDDSIQHNTLNGWMGVLTSDTLRAENPELKIKLQQRAKTVAEWNPLENITIPHMTRWKHTGVKHEEWPAAKGLHKGKASQRQSVDQGVLELCDGLPCGAGISGL